MRIESTDGKSWIEVRPWTDRDNDYSAFELEAHLEISHGTFAATNRDIHLFHLIAFADQLAAFGRDQSQQPQLDGTYDTYIRVRNAQSCMALDFCLGDAYCGGAHSEPRLTGTFEISCQVLGEMTHFFRQLSSQTPK
jgi:hypothetical protein